MRYLRMLSNSLIGGALVAAYLAVLILLLNPEITLRISNLVPLYVALELTYGLHFAVTFYVLIVVRQLMATEVGSPGWISVGVLTWLSMAAASLAATLMWRNRSTFGPMLLDDTTQRLTTAAGWMTACGGLFLVLGLVHHSFGRRGGRVAAALFMLVVIASLSLPLAARGPGLRPPPRRAIAADVKIEAPAAPRPRVVMMLLDGASLNFISLAAADGRLLNFGRMLDSGASMYLATMRPTQPGPVWTAVATGKLPTRNGVRAAARYRAATGGQPFELLPDYCFSHALVRFGFVSELPHTAASLSALPVWDILSGLGISVGVVGWPLSRPVHAVNGYLVSDQLHPNDLSTGAEGTSVVFPTEAATVARAAFESVAGESAGSDQTLAGADRAAVLRTLFGTDRVYEQVSSQLRSAHAPEFSAVRYRGLDAAGHDFLRYADPRSFGDVTDDERRSLGNVLPTAYAIVDDMLGRVLASLGPDDLLLVVSGFGMEPLGVGKRLLERALGNPNLSGTHEDGPDGFLLAYGTAVERGRRSRGAVVDVAPTLLYFFGLPVGRDMDGYARTDIFRKSLTEERPITYIPTYER